MKLKNLLERHFLVVGHKLSHTPRGEDLPDLRATWEKFKKCEIAYNLIFYKGGLIFSE